MAEEIIFTDYQADVFVEAEQLLKTQGYLGQPLFENTYVLSKKLADYVIENVPMSAGGSAGKKAGNVMNEATNAYNGVLGITVAATPTPIKPTPIKDIPQKGGGPRPILRDDLVKNIKPQFPTSPIKVKPAIATPIAQPTVKVSPAVKFSSLQKQTPGSWFSRFTNRGFGGFGGFNN